MGGVKWGYFLDFNTLHKFVIMMAAVLFCPEKPGPLGQVRDRWLCLKKRCKSLK
jgi:hypothetical protein